jgi:ribokinase
MRFAVVGHVEWCQFLGVERLPRSGEIVHIGEWWEEPAGGGAVAAVELARLTGEADLFTALGDDDLGRRSHARLQALGVRVHAVVRGEPTRRAVVFVDEGGERTINVLGDKLVPRARDPRLPWHELAGAEGVYFVSGDADAVRAARRADVLVATPRELPVLREAAVELDAIVGSGEDDGERFQPGDLDPPPRLVVSTAGPLGGWAQPGGPFRPAELPGPYVDSYGAGDAFAVGLTVALAEEREPSEAVAFAAERGAAAVTRRGAHGR